MTPQPRLDLIGLVVADMAVSLAFYRRLGLDLPPEADGEPHVECPLPGGLRLAWDAVDTVRSFDPDWTPPAGGHQGHKEPWDAFWGMRYAVVHDPDGNAVDLFAPLPGS